MADTVTVKTLLDNPRQTIVHLTGVSDGTGESLVKKVDITAVRPALNGLPPVSLDIEAVRWAIQYYWSIQLLWNHTAAEIALNLAQGSGYEDFIGPAGVRDAAVIPLLRDGRGAGGDGSILLTSNGPTAGAVYDITLWLRKATS